MRAIHVRWVVLCVALLALIPPGAAQVHPRDEVAFYVGAYGEVRPDRDAEVAAAHRVFDRVRAVADKNRKRLPRLVVVASEGEPWAIALPDGHIVLSREAVAICHRRASAAQVEARLAFVLGHELAHLANDDFWHAEVYRFLARSQGPDSARRPQAARSPDVERGADDRGFIFAALAGYRVETLLEPTEAGMHFLGFWVRQTTRDGGDIGETGTDRRVELLQTRLRSLEHDLSLFRFGLRLGHFDQCEDGVYFLRAFQKVYPGREVLNNLGYCYLQLARRQMDPGRAYLYWMPSLLDAETRATALFRRQAGTLPGALRHGAPGEGRGYLETAQEHLRGAVAADPGYLPSRLNLAAVNLYLGQPHLARAILQEARELVPGDPRVEGLDAVALFETSEANLDLWPAAVARLERLVKGAPAYPALRFNLARLLALRPRPAEARVHWNGLAADAGTLPEVVRAIVCARQSAFAEATCLRRGAGAVEAAWRWPVGTDALVRRTLPGQDFLPGWEVIEFDWFKDKLHGYVYLAPNGAAEVLELDGFVQMQVLSGPGLPPAVDLQRYCAGRLLERELAVGVIRTCADWAAWVDAERVREVWWTAR